MAADWSALRIGSRYRVTASDGENMIVDVVAIDMTDRLFVYDVVESNHTFPCPIGHVLRFSEVDSITACEDKE
jgi:hypothetical protein